MPLNVSLIPAIGLLEYDDPHLFPTYMVAFTVTLVLGAVVCLPLRNCLGIQRALLVGALLAAIGSAAMDLALSTGVRERDLFVSRQPPQQSAEEHE